jgi:hypothetical protein
VLVAREFTEITLEEVSKLSGQAIPSERISKMLVQLVALRQDMTALNELPMGETEPANIFVAGKEDQNA